MCWSSLPVHLRRQAPWSDGQPWGAGLQEEFSNEIKEEWIEYNRSKGLSTVNLCQCPNHYQFEDLDCSSGKRKRKSYKKTLLKKMKTQQKHALKSFTEKKEQKLVFNIQNLEIALKIKKKDHKEYVQEKSRLTRLGKSLDNAIQ